MNEITVEKELGSNAGTAKLRFFLMGLANRVLTRYFIDTLKSFS